MNAAWLPLTTLATSMLAAVAIFVLPEEARRWRTGINLLAAVSKIVLVVLMVGRVAEGYEDTFSFQIVEGVDFVLRADALGVMFAGLSSLLWLCTTVYAIGTWSMRPTASASLAFSASAWPARWALRSPATCLPS